MVAIGGICVSFLVTVARFFDVVLNVVRMIEVVGNDQPVGPGILHTFTGMLSLQGLYNIHSSISCLISYTHESQFQS